MDFCNTEEFPHAILRKLILQLWVFSFYNKHSEKFQSKGELAFQNKNRATLLARSRNISCIGFETLYIKGLLVSVETEQYL